MATAARITRIACVIKQYGGCDGIREITTESCERSAGPSACDCRPIASVAQPDSSLSVSWVVWAYCVFAIVA